MPKLFKRPDSIYWFASYYEQTPDGQRKRRKKCTALTDKAAANSLAIQWERDAADPDSARRKATTLSDAITKFLARMREEKDAGRRAADTVSFYEKKCARLIRVFETNNPPDDETEVVYTPLPLARITAAAVDDYISTRRAEGASESTISKELVALRSVLKIAKRRGLWSADLAAVLPVAFAPGYEPRKRVPSEPEVFALLAALPPDRAAQVAFMAAVGAEWGAVERAQRDDVPSGDKPVHVRGTKRETRDREVPIVTDVQRKLVAFATRHGEGKATLLFRRWGNVRRDLRAACDEAQIPYVSPNDFRRFLVHHWLAAGVAQEYVSRGMGHASEKMVRTVYGQLTAAELEARMRAGIQAVPAGTPAGQQGADRADASDWMDDPQQRNRGDSVPRDGIEPPTRGFSIHPTDPPSPRNYRAGTHQRTKPGTRAGQQRPSAIGLVRKLIGTTPARTRRK